jgi:hypothetical protein
MYVRSAKSPISSHVTEFGAKNFSCEKITESSLLFSKMININNKPTNSIAVEKSDRYIQTPIMNPSLISNYKNKIMFSSKIHNCLENISIYKHVIFHKVDYKHSAQNNYNKYTKKYCIFSPLYNYINVYNSTLLNKNVWYFIF